MRKTILKSALVAGALCCGAGAKAEIPAFTPEQDAPQCRASAGYAQDFDGRRTFLWRPQWLQTIAADEDMREEVLRAAENALGNTPYSVTHKTRVLPDASAQNYASIGPYWWPDPDKDDGLPYYRRDGKVNPERSGPEFDKHRLTQIGADMEALAIAFYLTDDERYAQQAAVLLRTWFIDPATRMLPNMNFAQGIPGKVQGRGEGLIEASDFTTIVEAIGLLTPAEALTQEDHAALRQWYAEFAMWMATSDIGEEQMQKKNNHGIFYDFYLAHFALFAGMDGVTSNVVDGFPEYRLARQMDKQGRFIEELGRTRSWHYSNYVVAGALRLATIGECVGKDLWNAPAGEDGQSLQTALGFLNRYVNNPASWPFPDSDLAAGRLDRMEARYDLVRLMAAGVDATAEEIIELP